MRWTKGRGIDGAESLLSRGRGRYVRKDGRYGRKHRRPHRPHRRVFQSSLSLSLARSETCSYLVEQIVNASGDEMEYACLLVRCTIAAARCSAERYIASVQPASYAMRFRLASTYYGQRSMCPPHCNKEIGPCELSPYTHSTSPGTDCPPYHPSSILHRTRIAR